ncbi:MAG: hypothetical protein ACJ8F7_22450 [Gemmataceae bacterium]
MVNAANGIFGLVMLICLILVIVKMFQNGATGLGIATILSSCLCGIGTIVALIAGWMNADRWGIRQLMLVYTVACIGWWVTTGINYPVYVQQYRQINVQ